MSDQQAKTPMSDHVARFWHLLKTEHVRILVDIRRDHDEGQPPHWDSASFGNDVAKALAAADRVSPLTTIRLTTAESHFVTSYLSNNFLRDARSITRRWPSNCAEYTEIMFTDGFEVRVVETPEEIEKMLRGAGQ